MDKKITIVLDKEREIKYTLGALIELEELTGKPMADIGKGMNMKSILYLLYVGLKTTDKELTMEQLQDLVTLDKLAEVNEKVMVAMAGLN